MTTMQVEKKALQTIVRIGILMISIASIFIFVINSQGTQIESLVRQSEFTKAAVDNFPGNGMVLFASEALATNRPVLFVFTPVEQCEIQYCLTAEAVEKMVAAKMADEIIVVEVPVHGFYVYTDGSPPDFLNADWDLYPVEPYIDWMPEASLTQFGWGLSETKTVLVNEEAKLVHEFDGLLELELLEEITG